MKGTSEPESAIDPIPADFLKQDVLDLPTALLLGGLKITGGWIDERPLSLSGAEEYLIVNQAGESIFQTNINQDLLDPLRMLQVVAVMMGERPGVPRAPVLDLLPPSGVNMVNQNGFGIFLDHKPLSYFLDDFTQGTVRLPADQTPVLTPAKLRGILDYIILERGDNSLVNFSLFWNLWRYKHKSSKKGSISPEKFLRTWFEKNLEAGAIFDPKSKQLYLIKNTERAQFYSFPTHWRSVKINTGNRLIENPKTEGIERMFSLYRRYVRGLASSLSFVRCASKLTRLGKLYTKPLEFTLNSEIYKVLERLRDIEHMENKDGAHRRRKRGKADFEEEYWRMMLREEWVDLQERLNRFERGDLIPDYLRDIVSSRRNRGPRKQQNFLRALRTCLQG